MTREYSLTAILTDENLMRCLREELQTKIQEPTTMPTETPTPVVEGCDDAWTKEYSLTAILTDERLMQFLRQELQ